MILTSYNPLVSAGSDHQHDYLVDNAGLYLVSNVGLYLVDNSGLYVVDNSGRSPVLVIAEEPNCL